MAALVVRRHHRVRRHGPLHPPDPAHRDLRRPVAGRARATASRCGRDPARRAGRRRAGGGAGRCTPSRRRPRGGGAAADAARDALALGDAGRAAALLARALDEPPADAERAAVVLELGQARARAGAPRRWRRCRRSSSTPRTTAAIVAAAIELSGMLFFAGRAGGRGGDPAPRPGATAGPEPAREQPRGRAARRSATPRPRRGARPSDDRRSCGSGRPGAACSRPTTLATLAMDELMYLRSASTAIDWPSARSPPACRSNRSAARTGRSSRWPCSASDELDAALRGTDEMLARARDVARR